MPMGIIRRIMPMGIIRGIMPMEINSGRRLAAPPLLTAGVWRLRRVLPILVGGLRPPNPLKLLRGLRSSNSPFMDPI